MSKRRRRASAENPGNPMADFGSDPDNLLKFLACLMIKSGNEEFELTLEDIAKLERPDNLVAMKTLDIGDPIKERFWFKLVTPEEGRRLAREHSSKS